MIICYVNKNDINTILRSVKVDFIKKDQKFIPLRDILKLKIEYGAVVPTLFTFKDCYCSYKDKNARYLHQRRYIEQRIYDLVKCFVGVYDFKVDVCLRTFWVNGVEFNWDEQAIYHNNKLIGYINLRLIYLKKEILCFLRGM